MGKSTQLGSGGTIIFCGGHRGAKCVSEGKKSKDLQKVADFDNFFLGGVGTEPPTGGNAPIPLLDAATAVGTPWYTFQGRTQHMHIRYNADTAILTGR